MARVTVEDCIDKVSNRFKLVLLAAHRSRQISRGAKMTVDRDNDKNPVAALREIADETISSGDLTEDLIHSLQSHVEIDEPDTDVPETIDDIVDPEITENSDKEEVNFDSMSEEELLAGIEGLVAPEKRNDRL